MKHIITLALLCLIQIGCDDKNEKTLCHEFFMKGPPFIHKSLTCDYGGEISFEKIGDVTYVVCRCNNEKKKEIVEKQVIKEDVDWMIPSWTPSM